MKASIVISTVILASLTPLTWAEERGVFEKALARAKLVKSTGLHENWDATGTKGNNLVTGPLYANAQKDAANELVREGAELRSQSELLAAPTREGLSHEVVRPGGAAELRSRSELLAAPTKEGLSHEVVRPGGAAELRSQSELLAAPTKEGVSDVARPGPSQSKDAAGE